MGNNLLKGCDFKEVNNYYDYLRSEAYSEKLKIYDELNQKYVDLFNKYKDSYQTLFAEVKASVCRREYAKSDIRLHRGYYSPSNKDLFVKNCDRGALFTEIPMNNDYNYEYLYDKDGKMICCIHYDILPNGSSDSYSVEFFVYAEDRVISLIYRTICHKSIYMDKVKKQYNVVLSHITECMYDEGMLLRYEYADVLGSVSYGIYGLEIEVNDYEDKSLKTVNRYRYAQHSKLIDEKRYVFTRDSDGFHDKYTIEDISGFSHGHRSGVHNVLVKRK